MSFILDALKKSETERQEQGSAEFVNVPTSGERREGPPAWLWVLGALLLVNLVVLAGIMMRSEPHPAAPEAKPVDAVATTRVGNAPAAAKPVQPGAEFADRLAAAREVELPRDEATPEDVEGNPGPIAVEAAPAAPAVSAGSAARTVRATNTATLPTIHEVAANGLVNVGALHIDIHVFAENAADRFVFINMAKYNEGSRLAEGPLVEEITVDGVVLSHNGTTFLVPRE
jgi:general secretion pathway protein B